MDEQDFGLQRSTNASSLETAKPHSLDVQASEDATNAVPSVTFGDLPTEIRLLSMLIFDILPSEFLKIAASVGLWNQDTGINLLM
jgi:hypothetical protein